MTKLKELYFFTRNIKNKNFNFKKKFYNNLFQANKYKKLISPLKGKKNLLYFFSKKNLKLQRKWKWRIHRKIYYPKEQKDKHLNKLTLSKIKIKRLKQIKRCYKNLFFIEKYQKLRKKFFTQKKANKKRSKKILRAKKALTPDCKGILTLKMSKTNIIFTTSDMKGQVLGIRSVGCLGFNGKKKRMTKFALKASIAAVIRDMKRMRWKKIVLCFEGYSKIDNIIFPFLSEAGVFISCIRVKTSIAHNGCRSSKPRTG